MSWADRMRFANLDPLDVARETCAALRLEGQPDEVREWLVTEVERLRADGARLREALTAVVEFPLFGPACQEHDLTDSGCTECDAQTTYVRRAESVDAAARAALAATEREP